MISQIERYLVGRKNTLVALAINAGLFVFKMVAGVLGHSQAMVTDAFETLADIVAIFVVLFGLRLAAALQVLLPMKLIISTPYPEKRR